MSTYDDWYLDEPITWRDVADLQREQEAQAVVEEIRHEARGLGFDPDASPSTGDGQRYAELIRHAHDNGVGLDEAARALAVPPAPPATSFGEMRSRAHERIKTDIGVAVQHGSETFPLSESRARTRARLDAVPKE